jgi:hypothetical protein
MPSLHAGCGVVKLHARLNLAKTNDSMYILFILHDIQKLLQRFDEFLDVGLWQGTHYEQQIDYKNIFISVAL